MDPVVLGLVDSLNRPGANVTGIANLSAELAPKQLQLLRELAPNAALFGVLVDPAIRGFQSLVANLQAAARTLGLRLVVVNARTESNLETAFASFSDGCRPAGDAHDPDRLCERGRSRRPGRRTAA
jgi:putative ABC transport system substrate-binding protein